MKMEEMSLLGLDNTKLEAMAQDIYVDLVEDACLGLCFEVHRAAKQGYFLLDETDLESMKDYEIVDQPGVDIFGQVFNQWKNKECVCPNCSRSIAASRFAPHLEKCLGMGRNSSRIASRRIASSHNVNKSESDQEDNDDLDDNDWSYGSEKRAKKRKSDKSPNSPRRAKALKHKNGEFTSVSLEAYKYYNSMIGYEALAPDELRSLLSAQCGVISEHTKRMCTRSLKCPQHTDEQRQIVRMFLLGPSVSTLPDGGTTMERDGYEASDGQALLVTRFHWDELSDVSPPRSASSKAGSNNSDCKKPKKKALSVTVTNAGGDGGCSRGFSALHAGFDPTSRKKKNKLPTSTPPDSYDDAK